MIQVNPFISKVIGVVVVLIVIVSVAVPAISYFTTPNPGESGENVEVADASLSLFELKPNSTVEIAGGDSPTMTINGTVYDRPDPNNPFAVVCESLTATVSTTGTPYVYHQNGASNSGNDGRLEIEYDGTKLDYGFGIVKTVFANHVYILIDKTDVAPDWAIGTAYVQISADTDESKTVSAYVNHDSEIVAFRDNYYSNGACFFGSYDEMRENTWQMGSHQTLELTYEPVGDAFHITGYVVDPSDTATIFVPLEYYTELPDDGMVSGPAADLIKLVPLLLVVGLIIAAVAAFITLKSREGGA